MSTRRATTDPIAACLADPAALLARLDQWPQRGWIREVDLALTRMLALLVPSDDVDALPRPGADGQPAAIARSGAEALATAPPLALLACALASHQASRGHLLLNLEQALADPDALVSTPEAYGAVPAPQPELITPARLLRGVDTQSWREAIARWPRCSDGSIATPLVMHGTDLYLYRFWALERAITRQVERRLLDPVDLDATQLRALLDPLFPPDSGPTDGSTHWQRIACATAARARFAVITGGPGTGKTTTVIRLLALLQAQALGGSEPDGRALRIRLAAPTGKAAARLNESIAAQVADLDLSHLPEPERVREAIPVAVSTLHRLLGARPDTRRFRYDAEQPLPLDVVVVDEASLIDVDLMAALFEALPPRGRLILIGDKDQLASVEAGAVLGTLCARADRGGYSEATRRWLQDASGEAIDDRFVTSKPRQLEQSIAALRFSYRFGADSGIGRFARAVNAGEPEQALDVLRDPSFPDLQLVTAQHSNTATDTGADSDMDADAGAAATAAQPAAGASASAQSAPFAAIARLATKGIETIPGHLDWLTAIDGTRPTADAGQSAFDAWAVALLERRGAFQLLTPLQSGPFGVSALNRLIEAQLAADGIIDAQADSAAHWYEGRPVLVTANDYNLGLMNGDMGITLRVPERARNHEGAPDGPQVLRVAFARGDDPSGVRWLLPTRLPRCQTVFAMTVHKAQGSEFGHAALVLPERSSPVLTRELIYTAATRASRHFTIVAPDLDVLARGIRQRTVRASRMFGDDGGT
jgi:exodeoxyribonuclease V alpha subunit